MVFSTVMSAEDAKNNIHFVVDYFWFLQQLVRSRQHFPSGAAAPNADGGQEAVPMFCVVLINIAVKPRVSTECHRLLLTELGMHKAEQ